MSPHAVHTVPSGENNWWKEATVYQVYPASFKDSNGDGWGDIPGLISKVPYLHSLGVDVVWLSPMYDSPMHDMGYDVSDYENVLPAYGTVEDIERLIDACHERGMKLILDLVINHTSDQHKWFQESRSSKDNDKRDWYFWRPPRYDEDGNRLPPSNYRGYFAGSTWTWDEHTQEYYLHLYAKEQPDLNWDNEAARKAIYDSAVRFWLDKGVDGFRVDTVNKYSKHTNFPDVQVTDPKSYIQPAIQMWCNGPRIHEFLREMYDDALQPYGDVVTIGELANTPDPEHVLKYVGASAKQLSMVFHLDIGHIGMGKSLEDKYIFNPWKLTEMKSIVTKWQSFIEGTDGWTTAFCENHDNGRSVSRFASDAPEHRERSAKMLALMMMAMTGTLFLYQGQEIGMINAPRDWSVDEYKDIEGRGYYEEAERQLAAGVDATRKDRIMDGLRILARDHARLPMQWDDSPHAGFTTGTPWMRAHDLYPEINVQKQWDNPESVLSFWRSVLRLRKEYREVFIHGAFEVVDFDNQQTFCFIKSRNEKKALVALNFTTENQPFTQAVTTEQMKLLVSNYAEPLPETLQPFEGRIYISQ
ncbi:glycoside hydrolase superfamily [Aspergillus pseudonomiae]|uniref:Alpha-glucosidase n=1 Tax=Aspergillus pseudonomiae TaxID=1506151 RepID=A0A5N6I8N7_9EURO|nr:glycoside hydrolase superfamily [Aspergillus pseudonomiae]KAB8263035.1 glycoside hydrolase superfamily [Aspergillus pseudonomiae]KAE8408718.1 glycoside hydrolase superfamily [Aspergillus pseudonomiae]